MFQLVVSILCGSETRLTVLLFVKYYLLKCQSLKLAVVETMFGKVLEEEPGSLKCRLP